MSAKEKIEQAAIEVFVREGVDAATTRQIAAAAGVSEGALYRHYPSKNALALGLFMAAHRRLSGLVAEAAARETTLGAKTAAIVRAYCRAADENWPLFTFHLLSLHRFLPYYQDDGRDPVSVVEALVKRAMIEAELPPADPRILASMAIGVVVQTALNKAYGRFAEPMSAHAPLMIAAAQAVLHAR